MECKCEDCRSACRKKPGWFAPGEVEKAAKLLDMDLKTFFKEKLQIDWWESDPDFFLLAPAIIGESPGTMYPGEPRGECVFYKDGLCEIHAAKPSECANLDCGDQKNGEHERVGRLWDKPEHQKQVRELYGQTPKSAPYEGGGIFGSLFGY